MAESTCASFVIGLYFPLLIEFKGWALITIAPVATQNLAIQRSDFADGQQLNGFSVLHIVVN